MIMALPDPYLRWKTSGGDCGIHSLTCLGIYWKATFGGNWQPVVVWAGTSTPVCGEIRSLTVTFGIVQAEFKLKRADGAALAAAASLVLALGSECPTGTCSGKFIYGQCFAPYAVLENNDNTTQSYKSLSGVDLNFASMSSAYLYRANLSGASLSNATLDGADLREATLNLAALSNADLTGAILRQATLDGAALYGANLTGADLREATLNGAVLSNADLTGVEGMHEVQLNGALIDNTTAPDGTVVDNVTALLIHSPLD